MSRYGLVSTAPSMEHIGVACRELDFGFEVLSVISGAAFKAPRHDLKDLKIDLLDSEFPLLEYVSSVAYIISAAETSNSIARFDGIKFGYRPEEYSSFEDIYVKSRTESFTFETKLFTLVGMMALTKDKYGPYFDKSLRARRLMADSLSGILERYDAVMSPVDGLKYTALPNLTGDPAIAMPGGFQIIVKKGALT